MIYCIINIIGNILVFASVAFLIGKAIWQWQGDIYFRNLTEKRKRHIKKWHEKGEKLFWEIRAKIPILKTMYIVAALFIARQLADIFFNLQEQLLLLTTLENSDSGNLSLAFVGTISAFGALFAGYLAILRSETNERQATTEEQGLITDRINKATERLSTNDKKGKPIIEVRLGALYALERIAQDSLRDHIQIMDILCAYVKTNSPLPKNVAPLRKDIKTALNIIGWRENCPNGKKRIKRERKQRYELDLSHCDLHGAEFKRANLSHARLNYSNLEDTKFYDSNLSEAWIQHANVNKASIHNTNMTSTNFYWTDMIGAFISESNLTTTGFSYSNLSNTHITNQSNLYNTQFSRTTMNKTILSSVKTHNVILMSANLEDADIIDSDLYMATFYKANLKGVNTANSYVYKGNFLDNVKFTKKQLNNMFCGIDVRIPKHLEPRPKHWPIKELSKDDFMKAYWDWQREAGIDSYADSKNMTVKRI